MLHTSSLVELGLTPRLRATLLDKNELPDDEDSLWQLVYRYRTHNNHAALIMIYDRLVEMNPSPNVLVSRGIRFLHMKKYAESLSDLNAALAHPTIDFHENIRRKYQALSARAVIFTQTNQLEEALKDSAAVWKAKDLENMDASVVLSSGFSLFQKAETASEKIRTEFASPQFKSAFKHFLQNYSIKDPENCEEYYVFGEAQYECELYAGASDSLWSFITKFFLTDINPRCKHNLVTMLTDPHLWPTDNAEPKLASNWNELKLSVRELIQSTEDPMLQREALLQALCQKGTLLSEIFHTKRYPIIDSIFWRQPSIDTSENIRQLTRWLYDNLKKHSGQITSNVSTWNLFCAAANDENKNILTSVLYRALIKHFPKEFQQTALLFQTDPKQKDSLTFKSMPLFASAQLALNLKYYSTAATICIMILDEYSVDKLDTKARHDLLLLMTNANCWPANNSSILPPTQIFECKTKLLEIITALESSELKVNTLLQALGDGTLLSQIFNIKRHWLGKTPSIYKSEFLKTLLVSFEQIIKNNLGLIKKDSASWQAAEKNATFVQWFKTNYPRQYGQILNPPAELVPVTPIIATVPVQNPEPQATEPYPTLMALLEGKSLRPKMDPPPRPLPQQRPHHKIVSSPVVELESDSTDQPPTSFFRFYNPDRKVSKNPNESAAKASDLVRLSVFAAPPAPNTPLEQSDPVLGPTLGSTMAE